MLDPVIIAAIVQHAAGGLDIVDKGASAVIAIAFLSILGWMARVAQRQMDKISRSLDINSAAIIGLQQQVLAHDLTASGIAHLMEPEDVDPKVRGLRTKYDDVQRSLDELRKMLLDK